jgi:hypothetical protein
MARVVAFGSYKHPREVTWLTGVALLLIIMAFALTGYLLPWDQKAYWATTVTINIARSTPLVGESIAAVMRGGSQLGALTLLRWYATHVLLLPAALVVLAVAHLYLMRRHGISGPITPAARRADAVLSVSRDPRHARRGGGLRVLITLAATIRVPLDGMADPSDATYVPRPEWYFLSLFQLLKYFPGRSSLSPRWSFPARSSPCGAAAVSRSPARAPSRQTPARHAGVRPAGGGRRHADLSRAEGFSGARRARHIHPLAIAGAEFAADQRCAAATGPAAPPTRCRRRASRRTTSG